MAEKLNGWIPLTEKYPDHSGPVAVRILVCENGMETFPMARMASYSADTKTFDMPEYPETIIGYIDAWSPVYGRIAEEKI